MPNEVSVKTRRSRRFQTFAMQLCVIVAFCWVVSTPGYAQLSTTATITGTVTDESKALVPDAAVVIVNDDTRNTTTVNSNADGAFIAPGLPVGSYSVSISKTGFQSYSERGIVLHPAVTATVNGVLKVGRATPRSRCPPTVQVETATIENSACVEAAQISTLPMNGRNYQGLGVAHAWRAEHIRRATR